MRWLLIAQGKQAEKKGSPVVSSPSFHHSETGRRAAVLGDADVDEAHGKEGEAEREDMGRAGQADDVALDHQGNPAVKLMEHLVTSELYEAEAVWEALCLQEGLSYHQVNGTAEIRAVAWALVL